MAAQKRKSGARSSRTRSTELPQSTGSADGSAFAVRIVFEYDGKTVRVASSQRVEMMVPSSDPVQDYGGQQGSWIEVHDRDGRTLYRQVLSQAIQTDVEAPSDADGHPLMRRSVDHPSGIFVALVPDLENAETLAVWHQPAGLADAAATTREVLRIPFPRRRTKTPR